MHRIRLLRPKLGTFITDKTLFKRFFLTFKACSQREANDAFGIGNVSEEDVTGVYVGCVKPSTRVDIANSFKEREFVTAYGTIRLDSQNKVRVHGQFDEDFDSDRFLEESAKSDLNFIDEQYFNDSFSQTNTACYSNNNQQYGSRLSNNSVNEDETSSSDIQESKISEVLEDANFIDKQYFLSETDENKSIVGESGEINFDSNCDVNSEPKINKNYEMARFTFNVTSEWRDLLTKNSQLSNDNQVKNNTSVYLGVKFAKESPLKNANEIESEILSIIKEERTNEEMEIKIDDNDPSNANNKENEEDKNEQNERPQNAFEYYKQLKSGIIEPESKNLKEMLKKTQGIGENIGYNNGNSGRVSLDSQGFRDFKEQRVDFAGFRIEEIVWHLKKNILFNENEILAINKPYGITCHGDKSTTHSPLLHDLLPHLAPLVNTKELYPVHRLDKEVTGVLLLAKTKQTAALLLSMFKERKIKKYYTAITRGVPDNKEGIIDIPMEEGVINYKKRMVLRPDVERDFQRVVKPSSMAKRAVTHYRIKKSHGNASLLEIFTETGVKHQIRCHLGFGLRTPILGDHKYSHLDKLVPQKLPTDMLLKLNVRQSKVRNIPLHLHCRLVMIPEIGRNGSTISIAAHLPQVFRKNAKALNLM